METKLTFWQKIKLKFSSENISETWKKTRNVALVINILGGTALAILAPFTIPVTVIQVISAITVASGILAGKAQSTTGKAISNSKTNEIIGK
jgi:hypothetical protein